MDTFRLKAYGKINLGLDVLRRLENGYHEVCMVMQTVGIYDELSFVRRSLAPAEPRILVTTDSGELPTDENNLIYRAARLLMEQYPINDGVTIHLQKNIPIAAGMAGGSTDAAATLKGMNRLFGLGLSQERLMELGLSIGADVPYCVLGGTALAEGIGEKLRVLPPVPRCFLLVAKPDINVSTAYVYGQLDTKENYPHPDIDGMVRGIEGGSLQAVADRLGNVLENVTVERYPVINDIKRRMCECGAEGSLMSGSGPTVFGIFTQEERARAAYDRIIEAGLAKQVFVTEPV